MANKNDLINLGRKTKFRNDDLEVLIELTVPKLNKAEREEVENFLINIVSLDDIKLMTCFKEKSQKLKEAIVEVLKDIDFMNKEEEEIMRYELRMNM